MLSKVRVIAAALVVDCGNDRFLAGFTGEGTIRAVVPLVVARPKMLVILVDIDQKNSCVLVVVTAVVCAWLVWLVYAPLTVFPSVVDWPRMLCIMVRFGPEEQLCSVQDRVDSTGAARPVATTGLMVQTVLKTVWRWRHSFCPYIPASWLKKVRPRSSSTKCSWLVLLVAMHIILPDSAENWIFRSCRSSQVIHIPVVVQMPIPMVQNVRRTSLSSTR